VVWERSGCTVSVRGQVARRQLFDSDTDEGAPRHRLPHMVEPVVRGKLDEDLAITSWPSQPAPSPGHS